MLTHFFIAATNVAQGKPSNQSSTARGGPASNGNDGEKSTLHDGDMCTETLKQSSPWWRVDLLAEYPIDLIRITTRGCCGEWTNVQRPFWSGRVLR